MQKVYRHENIRTEWTHLGAQLNTIYLEGHKRMKHRVTIAGKGRDEYQD